MGAQGKSSTSSSATSTSSNLNSMQRVKVYRLNDDGKWDDRGTGHVTVDYLERSEDLGLFVTDEEDNETLLAHRIRSDEIYRRQEDTIISWRDPEYSTELALSFQEATGCSYIWDHICSAQRNLHFNSLSDIEIGPRPAMDTLEASETSQANDETYHGINSDLRELPAVELSTLPLILKTVVESGVADQMRVTELIAHDQDFFPKLIDLFRLCEDLENLDSLHVIFKLVKGIILLNSPQIFEKIFGDEFIMDIIGSLEYDPDVPHIQHHRAFLKEHVVFKEAIPIKDPSVLSKIHETYRVGYIKDVILPRILDEATIASLNSIIHANNAIVVSSLKDDSTFIQELFARMRSSTISVESKKNLVHFLHEFCNLSKSLQLVQQMRLFRDLVNEGIFDIITDALRSQDKRLVLTGTDILILFLNQDPNLLRMYVTRQEGNALLGLLVKGMITDFGDDMHCQFLEILRSLLDSYTLSGSQRDTIIEIFYEKHLDQLIEVIVLSCSPKDAAHVVSKSSGSDGKDENIVVVKPEILSNICELLCFCVLHHPYRIKCNFLFNNVIGKVLYLTLRREKYLVVAAIRFVRTIISRHDEQLLLHIVKNNLLKLLVDAFVRNGNRYNLLNSAVLELFEYIRKNSEVRGTVNVVDPRKRIDERALEKEEEDYFNEDSDEEDSASAQSSHIRKQEAQPALSNGARFSLRPIPGGLVDYDDDDDDEDYNPPSRSKLENSSVDERTEKSTHKLKRRSSNEEEKELRKKQRLDKTLSNNVHATSPSTCSFSSSMKEDFVPKHNIAEFSDKDSNSNEETIEKKGEISRGCSDCLPNIADTRQASEEGSPLLAPNGGNNSSLEMAANGANVAGSEPYSVR
ncbi:hypothetical protein IFM89_033486 [Coptis chinensis]|uniref:Serine/threonine-protein phosphatase 4 regulatory subunit 3-like central domain-containing protein n=1 Tax=Coptis chinensis TaxID=261450 RepID=A0A835HYP9_9MAGN|nr:hypothetical protein IFM89_033486 [Coptis chinensis]